MRLLLVLLTGALVASAGTAFAAPAHAPSGCAFTKSADEPFGSPLRTYPISHGCVWLSIGPAPKRLPVVHVRTHLANGRVVNRAYIAPATNLEAEGLVGTCGLDSWARLVVAYPFVTVILQPNQGYDVRTTCVTDLGVELMWTLQLAGQDIGKGRPIWFTHGAVG